MSQPVNDLSKRSGFRAGFGRGCGDAAMTESCNGPSPELAAVYCGN